MAYELINKGPCTKLVKVFVPYEEMKGSVEEVKGMFTRVAVVPGFRIGKAPWYLVEQYYGKAIDSEIIKRAMNESYAKTMKNLNFRFVGEPIISNVDYKKGESLSYEIEFEILPEFDLPEYKEIQLVKKIFEVTDEDIERELKALQERYARFENVDRPVREGDYIICDYKLLHKDEVLDEAKQIWIEVTEEIGIPKLAKGLVGAVRGEERDVKVVIPKDYPKEELRGKKCVVRVKIEEIKEKKVPPLNDEFAKEVGNFGSLEELRGRIRQELKNYNERVAQKDIVAQIEDYLLKNTVLDLPPSVVEKFQNAIFEDTVNWLQRSKGADKTFLEEKEEELKESARREAEEQVKLLYILEEIAVKEGLDVTEEELDKYIEDYAKEVGKAPDEIKKQLEKDQKLHNLKFRIKENKVMKFLLENASITEEVVKKEEKKEKKEDEK